MDINFKTSKLEKTFNSSKKLSIEYGQNAEVIMNRMKLFQEVVCLNDVPVTKPPRRHSLKGDRENQFAVDLRQGFRITFCANHDPLPLKEDGGIDLMKVTAITILSVVNYH